MNHLAARNGKIRQDVDGRNNFQHGKLRHLRKAVGMQLERGRCRPCPFDGDVRDLEAHQFADPRSTIDMRQYLEQVAR
jgi:hypothetical protein